MPPSLSDAQRRAVGELLRVAPVADAVGARFAAAGHPLALVGGSVRDALLGRLGHDLDFTTSATPEQIEAVLAGWADAVWDIGRAFGTIGARKGGYTIEITTYRTESYEPGSRKPAVAYGDTLEGDLGRRDFTVNAMAVALPGHGLRRSVRRPRGPRRGGAADPRRPGGLLRRRPAADDAGGAVRRAAGVRGRPRGRSPR